MEFADDNPRTEHHKREDIAQDFGWMVGVVVPHRRAAPWLRQHLRAIDRCGPTVADVVS
jgi:hypothetical protein